MAGGRSKEPEGGPPNSMDDYGLTTLIPAGQTQPVIDHRRLVNGIGTPWKHTGKVLGSPVPHGSQKSVETRNYVVEWQITEIK